MLFLSSFFLSWVTLLAVVAASPILDYSMVLVGGGLKDDNAEVYSTIIDLAGGAGIARMGVISAASEDPCCGPDSSWVYYRDQLLKYGAVEVYYVNITVDTRENNEDPDIISHLRTLTGFMFGGGDQLRIIRSFYNGEGYTDPSSALVAIRETLYASGGVIAGTSAGTDCQTSQVMISGGVSYTALVDGAHVTSTPIELPNANRLTGYLHGIGEFPYGLLDTHFENRGRHGRMIRLLADSLSFPTGSPVAFGIDENTALVVTGKGEYRTGKVIGQRGVVLMDISSANISQINGQWAIENVLVSHLTSGDTIRLPTLEVTPAAFKVSLAGRETSKHASSSRDIFASEETNSPDVFQFNEVAESLFNSHDTTTKGYTAEQRPLYVVKMSKSAESVGMDGADPATGLYWFSYYKMQVNIFAEAQ